MAYSALNLKRLSGAGDSPTSVHRDGPNLWVYKSTDAMSTVRQAGYFANAFEEGMRINDVVFVIQVNASDVPQEFYITIVNVATSGTADVANGTSITLTDSD